MLTFWYKGRLEWTDYLEVFYSRDGGSTWTESTYWNGDVLDTWSMIQLELPETNNSNVKIRFTLVTSRSSPTTWAFEPYFLVKALQLYQSS